jgi:CHAT domain-containing protein
VAAALAGAATAQQRNTPSLGYHQAFMNFYDGEYKAALEQFVNEGRGAMKTAQSRWIDSICYEAMVGECYFEMGRPAQALDHYTAAVKLYLAFPNWMVQVQWQPIRPAGAGMHRIIPWAVRPPLAHLGQYPQNMLISQGSFDISDTVQHGGIVSPPLLFPIEVQEIVRCTALAIRRRAQLLGPLGQHDSDTNELIAVLSRHPGPPNHWSEAWGNLQLGLALIAGGREGQALLVLQRASIAAGEFEHPLTSVAQLELGKLAARRGDYDTALKCFEEASYAAVYYPDFSVLEEAFRCGSAVHLMANHKGIFPPLAAAIQWAKANRLRQLQASLLLSAAENAAVLHQTVPAAAFLDEARVSIGHRAMGAGRIGAVHSFLGALVFYQQKKIADGSAALSAAMNYMRQSSLWLFQISLADTLFAGGKTTQRAAQDLFAELLRDPRPADWTGDPMESLAVLVTPHPLPFEHWFEIVAAHKDYEAAIEIADRARRHRFFSALSLGGRLESLRWILNGPTEMLDKQAQLQRQDLRARYPAYDQLRQQAEAIRTGLNALPLVSENADVLKQQTRQLAQLAAIAQQQEQMLCEIAVRREPAAMVFPPLRPTIEIQQSLPKGHALLIFFATSRSLYGFLLDRARYSCWQVTVPQATVARHIASLLREMGSVHPNYELKLQELADSKWKKSAHELLDLLLKGSRGDFAGKFDELTVVPDGVLWYLPFEALQVTVDGTLHPLISRFRIRYAPTASLATLTTPWEPKPQARTGIVVGRLYPRQEEAVGKAAFADLAAALPGAAALKAPLPGPSAVYATLLDRLIVLDDFNLAGEALPFAWAPLPLDRVKAGSTLGDWMTLPWSGPQEIILPGFHTLAEEALGAAPGTKRSARTPNGSEIFLSVCGLMSSGARTMLLSRWRNGGQSTYDLVREFAQELPHIAPAAAWQRAVLLLASSRLNLDAEPRIKRVSTDESPRANHPFFWAGYMLVDMGGTPQKDDAKQPAPVLRIKRPALPPAKEKDLPAAEAPILKHVEKAVAGKE